MSTTNNYGNSKYWQITLPSSVDRQGFTNLMYGKGAKACIIKSNIAFVSFHLRKNVKTDKYFSFEGRKLRFRKTSYNLFKIKTEDPKTPSEMLSSMIKDKKLNESYLTAQPTLIRHVPNLKTTWAQLEDQRTTTQPPSEITFAGLKVGLSEKKRHFYIHGPPNTGKTTYWKEHIQSFSLGPKNNDWRYFDDANTWVVFDEWTLGAARNVGIDTLNQLMDGECLLNTKGGTKQIKNKHYVVFLSNFPVEETIPEHFLEAFQTRVNIIPWNTFPTDNN